MKFCSIVTTSIVALYATCLGAGFAHGADWRPDKNVEIIVWSGAGGGADRPARTMQRLFQEKKLLDVASVVTNKPGANGTVGMVYMNQNAGDGHYISMANATLVTNRITGVSPLSYAHTTPLALIAHDFLSVMLQRDRAVAANPHCPVQRRSSLPPEISVSVLPRMR